MLKPNQNKKRINPKQLLEKHKSRIESLDTELEDKGVIPFKPVDMGGNLNIDTEYLLLPKDITECTSKQLGQLLNAFTQQRIYMRTLIGWQNIALEISKREYYQISTPIYQELDRKQYPSEISRERYVNNHEEVKESYFNYRDEKRKSDLLELNLASIDDALFLISREISRRGTDIEKVYRNENVQSI